MKILFTDESYLIAHFVPSMSTYLWNLYQVLASLEITSPSPHRDGHPVPAKERLTEIQSSSVAVTVTMHFAVQIRRSKMLFSVFPL